MNINGTLYYLGDFEHPAPTGKETLKRLYYNNKISGTDMYPMINMYHPGRADSIIHRLNGSGGQTRDYRINSKDETEPTHKPVRSVLHPEAYNYDEHKEIIEMVNKKLTKTVDRTSSPSKRYPIPAVYHAWCTCLVVNYAMFLGISMSLSPGLTKFVFSFISGLSLSFVLFNILHDASHYVMFDNIDLNFEVGTFFNAMNFWGSREWEQHHVVHHHSFTSDPALDPDTVIFGSMKTIGKYVKFWPTVLVIAQLPLQAVGYHYDNMQTRIPLPNPMERYKSIGLKCTIIHYIGIVMQMAIVWKMGWYVIPYMFAESFMYTVNIIPDHHQPDIPELYIPPGSSEEKLKKQAKALREKTLGMDKDESEISWARMQITTSGNFVHDMSLKSLIYTRLFGGINLQVVHHLFPSVNTWYYPQMLPMIQEWCKEKDVKMYGIEGIYDCWSSCIMEMYHKAEIISVRRNNRSKKVV